jgi:hypothetical protein
MPARLLNVCAAGSSHTDILGHQVQHPYYCIYKATDSNNLLLHPPHDKNGLPGVSRRELKKFIEKNQVVTYQAMVINMLLICCLS